VTEKIECKRCHFRGEAEWFPLTNPTHLKKLHLRVNVKPYRGQVCPMCLQEERDKHKRKDRAVAKATRMLYSHAKKYGMKPMAFAKKFGWSITQMVHDINHNFDNWCPYCTEAYQKMGHGLADLTLDIINPQDPPYYENVRFCCSTCNSIKGQRGATAFGLHKRMVRERQEFLNGKPGTEGKPQYEMEIAQ